MDLKSLAFVLPKDFEYILFGACSMGSIEVAYELKNHTKFIMACPFIEYYQKQQGRYQSAAVTLIETDKLDSVAVETKKLLNLKKATSPFNRSEIQELTFDISNNVASYDFISFLKHNYKREEYFVLEKRINEAVVYENNTQVFLGYKISEYSGLSTYLPDQQDRYFNYYTALEWSKKSDWHVLFGY